MDYKEACLRPLAMGVKVLIWFQVYWMRSATRCLWTHSTSVVIITMPSSFLAKVQDLFIWRKISVSYGCCCASLFLLELNISLVTAWVFANNYTILCDTADAFFTAHDVIGDFLRWNSLRHTSRLCTHPFIKLGSVKLLLC